MISEQARKDPFRTLIKPTHHDTRDRVEYHSMGKTILDDKVVLLRASDGKVKIASSDEFNDHFIQIWAEDEIEGEPTSK